MKKTFLFSVFILLIATSCKKAAEEEVCYKCTDATGNYLQTVCGSNEQEAFDKSGIIGGTHDINVFRQYCKKQ